MTLVKASYLTTDSVADVAELFGSGGPDLVLVRDLCDPDPFNQAIEEAAQRKRVPRHATLEKLLHEGVPEIEILEQTAADWVRHRMPGLITDDAGFRHDA